MADQAVEVLLRLTFPYGNLGRDVRIMMDIDGATERLVWSYADDRTNDTQARDREVDRAVARQFAARARQEAVQRNRGGDYLRARRALESTAARIHKYAHGDVELRGLAEALGAEARVFAAPMAEPSREEAYFASANLARSRDAMGGSLKRPR